jgi:hypothetical protein
MVTSEIRIRTIRTVLLEGDFGIRKVSERASERAEF